MSVRRGVAKRRRMAALGLAALGLGTATALAVTALGDNMLYYFSPAQLAQETPPPGRVLRVGGLVALGSVEPVTGTLETRFTVTDGRATLPVSYTGALPDLFRECQTVVATGTLGPDGRFAAREILAKHDETYVPPEMAETLVTPPECVGLVERYAAEAEAGPGAARPPVTRAGYRPGGAAAEGAP